MRLLVFNAGSSSLKFEVIEFAAAGPARRLAEGSCNDSDGTGLLRWAATASSVDRPPARTHAEAAAQALDWLSSAAVHGHDLLATLDASAHRIVHGGARFRTTTLLGDAELGALAGIASLAPLHNPPALAVIEAVRERIGSERPLVGVFDTAYYADLPAAAHRYAVPPRWADELGVRRYGFHGIAHRYLCQRVRALHAQPTAGLRIIGLQLGRGCSVTATRGDRAAATSMGFTPVEGLVMGTRSGDIDAGAVLYAMERTGASIDAVRRALNEQSGLLGLSGRTADMRELLELERAGDAGAALAIECFCRRARHYVGGYLAELGGVDAIVFGGGIGENCAAIRRRIVDSLQWSGICLEPGANEAALAVEAAIHAESSRAAVYVVPVNEAHVIASEAAALLRQGAAGGLG
jgi:acetate kinase